ncbi:DNA replication/repair protein RecF [Staphylospora marina]|uniref:DNA replication/repair protein RecF n=1 Tax=Staphylospora marina TaxID=2490858 RepID=UPI000F5BD64E|nr:DNA replication/repair protein RecF [Staphylospora marina]
MRIETLELTDYRNIEGLSLRCEGPLHLFVGANAQGKTNILESIYVLALGKSHRTRSHRELIRFGKQRSVLKSRVRKGEQVVRLQIQLTEKGKKVSKNGVEQPRLSRYIGTLPAVLFAPEDLALVKGSPQVRRRFLDMEIGQVSPSYVHDLSMWNQLVQQRNSLLKRLARSRREQDALLDVLDEQMVTLAVRIWTRRFHFLSSLREWAKEIHREITRHREDLGIEYVPSVAGLADAPPDSWGDLYLRELAAIREREILRGASLLGPHRDDLRLSAGGLDLHTYGSQGQQRTAALSLKLAEIELIHRETGHYPVLLLDDVLSELDDSRKSHLLTAIRGKVQTFVTTTGLDGIDGETLASARVYGVKQGTISELG